MLLLFLLRVLTFSLWLWLQTSLLCMSDSSLSFSSENFLHSYIPSHNLLFFSKAFSYPLRYFIGNWTVFCFIDISDIKYDLLLFWKRVSHLHLQICRAIIWVDKRHKWTCFLSQLSVKHINSINKYHGV